MILYRQVIARHAFSRRHGLVLGLAAGAAMMGAGMARPHPFGGCPLILTREGRAGGGPGRRDALAQARLLFDRIAPAELWAALGATPAGGFVEQTARFVGDDARWRFVRPVDLPSAPDALIILPENRQYLIRPLAGCDCGPIIAVGLAEGSTATELAAPMLAAQRGDGTVFILDPVDPGACRWVLAQIASDLADYLTHHYR